MKRLHILPVLPLLFLLLDCSSPDVVPAESPDLAAVLDIDGRKLFVRPDDQGIVLDKLGAKQVEGDTMLTASLEGETISFSIVPTATPLVFFPPEGSFLDSLLRGYIKIYTNADCSLRHRGFRSDCIATFGPHRAFGNMMQWRVDPWTECTRGKGVCIERWKPVGTITYYPGWDCFDTMVVVRDIMKYRCD